MALRLFVLTTVFLSFVLQLQCRHEVVTPGAGRVTSEATAMAEDFVTPSMKHMERLLKNFTSAAIRRALPSMYKLLHRVNVSSECTTALLKYAAALKNIRLWAMRMFDATAKLPSGVFGGTLTEFGAFEQCLKIRVKTKRGDDDFQGQYCSVEAMPTLGPRPSNLSLAVKPVLKFDDSIMDEIRTSIFAFYKLTLRFGICVPSSCTSDDMQGLGAEVVKPLMYRLKVSSCHVHRKIQVDAVHVVILCVGLFLLLLLAVGSFLDLRRSASISMETKKVPEPGLLQNIALSFSLPANVAKLISSETATGEMRSLHGIRALSMTWVILGHTYIWINFQAIAQTSKAPDLFNDLAFEVILNGWLSVTSFIFLSGLLTTYSTMRYVEITKRNPNVLLYTLRRFLRIYPAMLLIMGSVLFLPWVGDGPFWSELPGAEVDNCRRYWWTNLLFINNFRPITEMCMQHSWYLSTDMQLHIVALLVLLPFNRSAIWGFIMLFLLTVAGISAVGIITYVNNYDPTILISTGNAAQLFNVVEDIHVKFYTYLGAYCVGIATAYILLKFKKVKISKIRCLIGWCVATLLSLSSLYGLHRWNVGAFPGPLVTATYAAVHRTTFVIGLAWVAFVCVTGNSPMVSSILTWRPFIIISRLTFMAYLAQGPVIWTRYGSMKERLYFSHFNMFYEYLGNLTLSLAMALIGYLAVEAPFAKLERLMFFRVAKIKGVTNQKTDELTQVDSTGREECEVAVRSQNCQDLHSRTIVKEPNFQWLPHPARTSR